MRTVQRIYAVHLHMFWPITRCQSRKKVDRKRQSIVKHRVRRCKMKRRQMRDTKSNTARWPSNCAFLALRRTHQSMKDCLTIRWENKRRLSIKKKTPIPRRKLQSEVSQTNASFSISTERKSRACLVFELRIKISVFNVKDVRGAFIALLMLFLTFFLMKEKQGGTL